MLSMRAAILAVGSELLGTNRVDSNSLAMTAVLERFGVELIQKTVVGDSIPEIASTLKYFLPRVNLILISGGLGPTEDDLTREAVADALGREISRDETLLGALRERFADYGIEMPTVNEKQADVIAGARVLENPNGTAPGLGLRENDCTLFLFPGVPSELEWMISMAVEPWLVEKTSGEVVETRILKVACIGESSLEERILPAYDEFGRHGISVLSSPGDIEIRMIARGSKEERSGRLDRLSERIRQLAGTAVYGEGAEVSLESVVGGQLISAGMTVATAESCTGGLVAERLTRVPGSSVYFLGSVVAYENSVKTDLLGVRLETIEECGAVSQTVVEEMASGIIERLDADFGVAISGIAGPGGGTAEKPIGTVYIGIAQKGEKTLLRQLRLPGDRGKIRWLASQWALELLRKRLISLASDSDRPMSSRFAKTAAQGDQSG
jgi:nicotinamide-nucleotide amidase